MKIKIVDRTWKIVLQTPTEYVKTHGANSPEDGAHTDVWNGVIYFRTDEILECHVRHELFHAYFSSTCTEDCKLDMGQTEELSANIVGKYGPELVKNAHKVYKFLKANG